MLSKLKKAVLVGAALTMAFVLFASVMYLRNRTPQVPAIQAVEAASPTRPFVVKVHAQWCPVCMLTKSVWSQIESVYAQRANLVVFDLTDQDTTAASRIEARRLGLETVFDEQGWTGTVLVVDGRSREVLAAVHGSRDFEAYRAAIEAALRDADARGGPGGTPTARADGAGVTRDR